MSVVLAERRPNLGNGLLCYRLARRGGDMVCNVLTAIVTGPAHVPR